MSKLPKQYEWLLKEEAPRILVQSLKLYGTLEKPGSDSNATILGWANEVGHGIENIYKADSIPWCGLVMGVIVMRAGYEPPKDFLWALNWGSWGQYVESPMLGDILVFTRKVNKKVIGGHVGIYIGENKTHYYVLGGNQNDMHCIAKIPKSQLYIARRTTWNFSQPKNVRKVMLNTYGNPAKSLV